MCACVGRGEGLHFFITFQKGVYLDSRKVFNSSVIEYTFF